MKLLRFLTLITLLTTLLFAKSHEGSFNFMDLQKAKNSFDTTIEVKYSIDTLMGEPLVKAEAKYEIMGLVNIDGKDHDLSKKQLDKLKIYNLKIKVPFESNTVHRLLWIEIDMGAMGKQGEWSYNRAGSPNWSKWIIGEGGYLSKKDAIKAYKGFERLGMTDGLGSLATAVTIKFDVSGVKEKNSSNIDGEWYRKKDNRLLSIQANKAIYPNGSKGKWKGHSTKYRNIKYLGDDKWSCEAEFYQEKKGFFWDVVYIYKIDNNTLKAMDFKNKITYWSR
jgi:hypothetical protein